MALLSERINRMQDPATITVTDRARALRRTGRDVIVLGSGEPDLDTPDNVKEAAIKAIRDGKASKYTPVAGIPELKAAIARKLERENRLNYEPDEIIVSAGGKQVLFNAFMATLDAGDEVIIPAPYWVSYPDMVRVAGGNPIIVKTHLSDSLKIRPASLEGAITNRTKWLILNSPSNPAGIVYSPGEIVELVGILRAQPHVGIISDEIYEHLVYDDFRCHSPAHIAPDLRDRILVVNGVSKAYCMAGWRIGYAAGPELLIRAMARIQSQSTANATAVSQWAAVAALDGSSDFIARHSKIFAKRRNHCLSLLKGANGLRVIRPHGAFYIYALCEGVIGRITPTGKRLDSDVDVAAELLEREGVAVVPGSAFGFGPALRISYAAEMETLKDACARIEHFCASLR